MVIRRSTGHTLALDMTASSWSPPRWLAPRSIFTQLKSRAVTFGASAGDLTSVPVTSLFALKTVSEFSLLAWRAAAPAQARADVAELTGLFEAGKLHAAAETTLPLAEAVQAHRLLEDRTVLGRILLVP